MFNQISKFHLAQLLDWKIHFGSLLTKVVKPSLGFILQFSILVRNISLLLSCQTVNKTSLLEDVGPQPWSIDSLACLLVMTGQPQRGYN